jgi:hypothetical protein
MVFEIIESHIAKGTDSRKSLGQCTETNFALVPPGIVAATRVLMPDHGIAHHQPYVGRYGKEFKIQRTAIQHEGVPRAAMARDELVHDSASHLCIKMFCLLAHFRDRREIDTDLRVAQKCERSGHFEGSRGTQPGSQWHVANDGQISTTQSVSGGFKHSGNATNVIAPVTDSS